MSEILRTNSKVPRFSRLDFLKLGSAAAATTAGIYGLSKAGLLPLGDTSESEKKESLNLEIAPGIHYDRDIRINPRPLVIHSIKVDMTDENIKAHVTPGDDSKGMEIRAQRTTTFLKSIPGEGIMIGVNGGFAKPFNTGIRRYPNEGDPVDMLGLAISDGVMYSEPIEGYPALCFVDESNTPVISEGGYPIPNTMQALAGNTMLISEGQIVVEGNGNLHPRTGYGVTEDGGLVIFVIDGRLDDSFGVDLREFAEIILEKEDGVIDAINGDGGGSSYVGVRKVDKNKGIDKTTGVNTPIDRWIPGTERPIGNHLAIIKRK